MTSGFKWTKHGLLGIPLVKGEGSKYHLNKSIQLFYSYLDEKKVVFECVPSSRTQWQTATIRATPEMSKLSQKSGKNTSAIMLISASAPLDSSSMSAQSLQRFT